MVSVTASMDWWMNSGRLEMIVIRGLREISSILHIVDFISRPSPRVRPRSCKWQPRTFRVRDRDRIGRVVDERRARPATSLEGRNAPAFELLLDHNVGERPFRSTRRPSVRQPQFGMRRLANPAGW